MSNRLRDTKPLEGDDALGLAAVRCLRAPRVGEFLKGRWHVEQQLGFGGMASVYAGRHRNGRRVAVKFMHPELAVDKVFTRRFLREGYIANKVGHPGAVAVLDDDVTDDGTPFLVMDLLEGESLHTRIMTSPLSIRDALDVIARVADVLAAAHDKGIVHRDVKPDNVFLTVDGEVKLLDFGIARLKEAEGASLTHAGDKMGTVGFMPPEQARGLVESIDARTDVWALGATLYQVLTGQYVHPADTPSEALVRAMTARVPPMRELLPYAPASVVALLDRALAFERENRFPDARAFAVSVREALAEVVSELSAVRKLTSVPPVSLSTTPEPSPGSATATMPSSSRSRGAAAPSVGPALRTREMLAVLAFALVAALVAILQPWRGVVHAPRTSAAQGVPPEDSLSDVAVRR